MADKTEGHPKAPQTVTEDDRGDLIAVLERRLGTIPDVLLTAIRNLGDVSQIDHLILVAANAADWSAFVRELHEPGFRIVESTLDSLPGALTSRTQGGYVHGK